MSTIQASEKTLDILNAILPHFVNGISQTAIATTTGLSACAVSRHVAVLVKKELIELIPETGYLRPSHRLGRFGITIFKQIEAAKHRLDDSLNRMNA